MGAGMNGDGFFGSAGHLQPNFVPSMIHFPLLKLSSVIAVNERQKSRTLGKLGEQKLLG